MTDQPDELHFPDIRALLQGTHERTPVASILLSAALVETVAKYARRFAAVEKPALRLTFYGPDHPVSFGWEDARHEVSGLLMPMLDAEERLAALDTAGDPAARTSAAATPLRVPAPDARAGVTPLVPDTIAGVDDVRAAAALDAREQAQRTAQATAQKVRNRRPPRPAS